jgi:hypothetical protein
MNGSNGTHEAAREGSESVMSKTKMIAVGDGYEVTFRQRARGEETPYWQGEVFKDGKAVGEFSNNGRGGATHIHPPAIVAEFERLVDEAAPDIVPAKLIERAAIVVHYAEMKGYYRSAAGLTLADLVREFARQTPSRG